jgi:hypothetical protein
MVHLLLSSEELKTAPAEVKNWLRSLLLENGFDSIPERPIESGLAKLSTEEASLVLDRIRNDYIACQVFFELGRDSPAERTPVGELHRTAITELVRHARLGSAEQLTACLERILEAFQAVRRDPSANLFAFDQAGNLYVHAMTHQSIKTVWQAIVTSHLIDRAQLPQMTAPAGPTVPIDGGPST